MNLASAAVAVCLLALVPAAATAQPGPKDGYTATSEYAGADGKWTTASVVTGTRAK